MSWGMSLVGSKKAVIAAVKKQRGYGDESQLNLVKDLLARELEGFPEQPGSGIEVLASGHHDQSYRQLSINVRCVQLALEGPESPSPAPSSAEPPTECEGQSSSSSS